MLPYFKAYPKDIVFELRACDPQDAPLVLYLATVTWPDGGIDPQDERQLSRLRKMLGWRKDTFVRAIKSYIEVCGEGAGKLLPSFLKSQQSAPKLQASASESHASDVELHASDVELQKIEAKSFKSSRANTSELESEGRNQRAEGTRAHAHEKAPLAATLEAEKLQRQVDGVTQWLVSRYQLPLMRHMPHYEEASTTVCQTILPGQEIRALEEFFQETRGKPVELRFLAEKFAAWLAAKKQEHRATA